MTETLQLLGDNRLSEGARLIGLWIAQQPEHPEHEGWVEVRFDSIRPLLYGFPSDDVIRRHLRMLTGSGWAERRPGGRGRSDLYKLLDPDRSGSIDNRTAQERVYNPDRLGSGAGLSVRSSSYTDVEGEVEGKPPVVPLSPKAEEAIEQSGDKLAGCRGALRDYLRQRVPSDRQYGYVQTIVGWRDGISANIWRRPDGSNVPAEDQTSVLADALNDLAASDEAMMRRPVGDPANLRTKINVLLKRGHDGGNGNSGHGSGNQQAHDGRGVRAQGGRSAPAPVDDLAHLGG